MNELKQFDISFKGLKTGKHLFHYTISKSFFENFEFSEINDGEVTIDLDFTKNDKMLILDFTLKGYVKLICDRCLEVFNFPVKSVQNYIIKFGQEYNDEDDSILIIPDTEHKINIGHLIYEYIILSLPIKRTHSSIKECNKIIGPKKKIKTPEISNDPRWDELKKLKLKK